MATTEIIDSRNLDSSLSHFQSVECILVRGGGKVLARLPPVGLCLSFPLYLPTKGGETLFT